MAEGPSPEDQTMETYTFGEDLTAARVQGYVEAAEEMADLLIVNTTDDPTPNRGRSGSAGAGGGSGGDANGDDENDDDGLSDDEHVLDNSILEMRDEIARMTVDNMDQHMEDVDMDLRHHFTPDRATSAGADDFHVIDFEGGAYGSGNELRRRSRSPEYDGEEGGLLFTGGPGDTAVSPRLAFKAMKRLGLKKHGDGEGGRSGGAGGGGGGSTNYVRLGPEDPEEGGGGVEGGAVGGGAGGGPGRRRSSSLDNAMRAFLAPEALQRTRQRASQFVETNRVAVSGRCVLWVSMVACRCHMSHSPFVVCGTLCAAVGELSR